MKSKLIALVSIAAALASLAVAAALAGPLAKQKTRVAPAHLVVNGKYSDVRFIDMTVPHHLMAIQMARIEVAKGEHSELKDMARSMIAEQTAEIAELKKVRQRLTGASVTPTMMNPHEMQNTGMPAPSQLASTEPTDLAFIDAMVPHHSSLIPLANVTLRRSGNSTLKAMARSMIDSQAKQIGQMINERQAWYPTAVAPPRP